MAQGENSSAAIAREESKNSKYGDAVQHMNEDHASSVADYVRYYGGLNSKVENVEMTDLSLSGMTIKYGVKKRDTIKIPFQPPLSDTCEYRYRLIKMANEAIVSRVPTPEFPNVILSATLIVILFLFGTSVFCASESRASFPKPLNKVVEMSHALAHLLFFRSIVVSRIAFCLAMLIHMSEGLYVAMTIRRVTKGQIKFHKRACFWIVQTTIVGFPSLVLFLQRVEQLQDKKGA